MDNIIDGLSMNIEQTNLDKLRSVFPECVSEGKLDIDKLLSLCGEYIDNDFEKYRFEWKGKAECLRLAQKRSSGTLRPCPTESVNWDTTQNLYIEGDNLEVLKLLQSAYYRKVKMIYIDPPYNTGNDFVYADDFADPLARYKEVTQQTTKSNPETMGRYHTNWLNMMYPRLRLAANLLRDDGAIFISINDCESENLRKLCDEVFGEENFIAQIVWQKAFSPKNDAKFFSSEHEYVLIYVKQIESFILNGLPREEKHNARFKNPDNDPRGPWASSDLLRMEHRDNGVFSITTPSGKTFTPEPGTSWRHPESEILEMLKNNEIWFGDDGNSKPRRKRFLSDVKQSITPQTIWKHTEVGHTQSASQLVKDLFDGLKLFDFPKPVGLVDRCVRLVTQPRENDIILDFFSGSATTAHAVMQLNAEDGGNRRFILVQLPEVCDEKSEAYKAGYKNICEIGKERIRRAGKKLTETKDGQLSMDGEKAPLDIGFKVFKLDTSNMKLWDTTPIADGGADELVERMNQMVRRIKPERSDLDMVYEVMLKLGVPLTYPVQQLNINGKPVYEVGEDCLLLICLAEFVEPEDVQAMADYAPAKMIMSRDSFKDDTAMANAYYILRDRQIELKLV